MELKLVMFTSEGERRDFPIDVSKATIGRNTESTLQIPLSVISRRHCELIIKKDTVTVRDLGSSNGTYVNNKRVQESPLAVGDTLTVGPVVFTVVINDKPDQIKPIKTILDGKKKKKSSSKKAKIAKKEIEKVKSAAETGDSMDLEAGGSDEFDSIELEGDDHNEEHNPLSELEALSKQKKL